jgi:hypothetical protein
MESGQLIRKNVGWATKKPVNSMLTGFFHMRAIFIHSPSSIGAKII